MKPLPGALLLALVVGACARPPREAPLVTVNGEPITLSQVRQEQAFLGKGGGTAQDVLNSLIDQDLILQEGRRLGVSLSSNDLKSAEALALAGTDLGLFKAALAARGLSYAAWRRRLAVAAKADAVVQVAVRNQLHVGHQEIQDHYWEHITAYRSPVKRVLRQIYTRTRRQAEAAERELDLGEPFAEVARELGQGPEAKHGGLLGPEASYGLPKVLAKAAARLKPGARSPIVASHWGYHILECDAIVPAVSMNLEEASPLAHATLLKKEEQAHYRLWLARLRESADIKQLNPLPPEAAAKPIPKGAR